MVDNEIALVGDEFHHLANVMRIKAGEKVCLFNGDGFDYICEVLSVDKKQAVLRVLSKDKNDSEPNVKLTVFGALSKGEKMSLIAQKLTEIGAVAYYNFYSKFCDVKPTTTRLEKLEKTVVSACKQCGRSVLMKTSEKVLNVKELAEKIKNYDACYLAYENEENCLLYDELKKNAKSLKNVAVIIGAEGGFETSEVELLQKAGAKVVSFGKRILRTDTASIFACSLIVGVLG